MKTHSEPASLCPIKNWRILAHCFNWSSFVERIAAIFLTICENISCTVQYRMTRSGFTPRKSFRNPFPTKHETTGMSRHAVRPQDVADAWVGWSVKWIRRFGEEWARQLPKAASSSQAADAPDSELTASAASCYQ
jgi:hypothetical protein